MNESSNQGHLEGHLGGVLLGLSREEAELVPEMEATGTIPQDHLARAPLG